MKLARPFVQLPYFFDASRLELELDRLSDRHWLPHPSGMPGNSALPLVSRNAEDNDEFDGPMLATRHLDDSPYIQQCMHSIGEVYGRSRLMGLAAGAEVSRHVDFNYHWYSRVRIHIPILTSSDVTFYCGDEAVNMAAGSCWIFDSWRHHRVVNAGSEKRIHLVLDTAGSSKFWQTVQSRLDGTINLPTTDIGYEPDKASTVQTEKFNSAPVMAPGEMQALVADLMDDLQANSENPVSALRRLDATLAGLVHDWRALWSQHGYSHSGIVHYQQLLKSTVEQLPKSPRELTTASNNIGAVPVVMQRIVRAALRPDLSSSFEP